MNTPPFVPDVAGFQKAFPIFLTTSTDLISSRLSMAARMISPCVWGTQFLDGVQTLAAALLVEDPMGTSTASKPDGNNLYRKQFEALRREVVGGGFGVAGGRGGPW